MRESIRVGLDAIFLGRFCISDFAGDFGNQVEEDGLIINQEAMCCGRFSPIPFVCLEPRGRASGCGTTPPASIERSNVARP